MLRMLLLGGLLLAFILLNLLQGTTPIAWSDLLRLLAGGEADPMTTAIFWEFRLPRVGTALLAGASIGISGLLMQTLFRNPIAGPDVLGISMGAHLGAAVVLLAMGQQLTGIGLAGAAVLGAFSVLILLLSIAWRLRSMTALLLIGLMLSSVMGAVVSLLQYFSTQQDLQQFVFWTMGSLSGTTRQELALWSLFFVPTALGAWLLSKPLDGWLLGEQTALSLGVPVQRLRLAVIVLTAILTGLTTAFCGPIAFVGIAVPHFARMLFRSQRHRLLLPSTALLGMLLLLICQWIAVQPAQDRVIPINILTSLFGAPMVIWLLWRQGRSA